MNIPRHLEKEIKSELKKPRKMKIKLKEGNTILCETGDIEIGDINPSSRYDDDQVQTIETIFRPGKNVTPDNAELTYYSDIENGRILLSSKSFGKILMDKDDQLIITWKITWER